MRKRTFFKTKSSSGSRFPVQEVVLLLTLLTMPMVLSGCSSTPARPFDSKQVSTLGTGQARLIIYRVYAWEGRELTPAIRIDGAKVGGLDQGTVFFHDLTPGDHRILVTTETTRDLEVHLKPGETQYVRIQMMMGFSGSQAKPQIVEPSVASTEVASLELKGTVAPVTVVPALPMAAPAPTHGAS